MPESDKNSAEKPILTFGGKRYDLNSLPKELKELIPRLQVAEAQLRMHDDTIQVLALGREALVAQINEKLKGVIPLSEK